MTQKFISFLRGENDVMRSSGPMVFLLMAMGCCLFPSNLGAQTSALPSGGMVLWLKADAGVTPDGSGNVSAWPDQSPAGNNATSSGNNEPVFVSGAINGKPALAFNGSTSYMTIPYSSSLSPSNVTVFAVAVQSGLTTYPRIVSKSLAVPWTNYPYVSYELLYTPNGAPYSQCSVGNALYPVGAPSPVNIGQPNLFSFIYDGSNESFWQNGTLYTRTSFSGSLQYGDNTPVFIGQSNNTYFLNGQIAEVLIYNRALSSEEHQQVEVYLADKYGLYHPNATWPQSYSSAVQYEISKYKWSKSQADAAVAFQQANPQLPTPGLTLWFKPDLNQGLAVSGANVTSWTDQISHVTLSASSSPPTYIPNNVNGIPGVHFAGNPQQYLHSNDYMGSLLDPQITTVFVAQTNTPQQGNVQIAFALGQNGYRLDRGFGYASGGMTLSTGNDSSVAYVSPSPGQLVADGFAYDRSTYMLNYFRNGAGVETHYVNSVGLDPGVTIGSDTQQAYWFWNGNIEEILVYDHVLSAEEWQFLTVYLANKYALPSAYPLSIFPPAGNYSQQVQVSIVPAVPGTPIRYTTDGTTPTGTSTLYTGPFYITATTGSLTETVNAIAAPLTGSPSAAYSSTYTIGSYPSGTSASPPVYSLASTPFIGTLGISLTSSTPNSTIYYTTDGTDPAFSTTRSTATGTISVTNTETIRAITSASGLYNSPAVAQTYTLDAGPQLSNVQFDGAALTVGGTLTAFGTLSVSANTPYTLTKVEFYIDGTLVATDTNGADGYSTVIDPSAFTDGSHTLKISGYDNYGARTDLPQSLAIALAVPSTPVIASPASGIITSHNQIAVNGTATPNTTIIFYDNGTAIPGMGTVTAAQDGTFLASVPLQLGDNPLQVTARNRVGEGAGSTTVTVHYDNTLPQPTTSLSVVSKPHGQVELDWSRSNTAAVNGYEIFRSQTPITSIAGLSPIATVAGLTYTDTNLPGEGTYYYVVVTIGSNGTTSPLSSVQSGVSDNTPPTASIQYVAQGPYDPAHERYGVGAVNITVTTSEPLAATPFLTIFPPNGLPLPVLLSPGVDNLHYVGTALITSSTPSSTAVASFSGLDLAGNHGTSVTNGQYILIDTAGPQVTQLVTNPNGAIQTDPNNPTTITFTATLSKALPTGAVPQFTYSLSNTATIPVAISSVTTGTGTNTWNVTLPLPATAGQPPETLTLYYQASDDLGNVGKQIVPPHQFQVYQGDLPGLSPPAQLTTTSLDGGRIQLDWTSVPDATGYVLYRGTDSGTLTQLTQLSTVLTYRDSISPLPDGTYYYTVAAVRQQGSQTTIGAQSNPVVPGVSMSATPLAPSELEAHVVSTGVQLTWIDPGFTTALTLKLYRASSAIGSLDSAHYLATIPLGKQAVVDPTPTPAEPNYALVAVDAAGNVSSITTAFADVGLLPVTSFTITQANSDVPHLTWSDQMTSLSGYDLYLGPDSALQKLDNPGPLSSASTTYDDGGYSGDVRRYTIKAYDASHVASPARSLTLVPLTAVLDPNAVIKRGVMNQLNYTVTNPSNQAVSNIQLQVYVGGVNQISSVFSLDAGASAVVPVVVGGYASLTGTSAPITTTINVVPNPGEKVSIVRTGTVPVTAGQLGLQVLASNFTLGGAGQAQFTLTNTSAEPIEIISAHGNQPSPDVHFNLLDGNGQVIGQQALNLTSGNNVTTLTNGDSVILLAPNTSVTTPATTLSVPSNLGASVTVQAKIDHIYYDRGQADQVKLDGLAAQQSVATTQVPYTGLVTSVTPANSNGDQSIVISGLATVTGSSPANPTPVPNANLNLNISTNGFQRTFPVTTDGSGNFSYTFTLVAGEPGGSYNVWAINPLLNDTTPQMQFSIRRLVASPTAIDLQIPRNYTQTLTLNLTNSPSSAVANVTVAYLATDQPAGTAPGITVTPGAAIAHLDPTQTSTISATILADGTAPASGTLYLRIASAENPRWQLVPVNYSFADAVPILQVSPSTLELGVAPGSATTQTINLTNVGLAPLVGANIVLQTQQGTLPPSWATLGSASTINSLAVNTSQNIAVTFAPDAGVSVGDYYFQVVITAQNHPSYTVPIHVAVNTATTSGGQFLIVDAFTSGNVTTGFTGGLAKTTVTLQNQAIYSSVYSVTTGADGLATFSDVPVGTYTVQITASNHQTYSSTLVVQPGVQFSQQVVLQYNPVQVTWNVAETTIQDQYNLVFTTTFDTNVPLPVLVFNPNVINLPLLKQGDVYNVQSTLTNSGQVRADNLNLKLPADDAYIHYEMLGTMPDHLDAGQTITLYYKLTCLQTLPTSTASLKSRGPPGQMIVQNIEQHSMPLYYRLLSLKIAQTMPSTNSYIAKTIVDYSATCANGTPYKGNAFQAVSYIGAGTPQAVQQQAQKQITSLQSQSGGSGGSTSGGSGGAAIIVADPAKDCQLTCDINIGTPPLKKQLVGVGNPIPPPNRVNPGGFVFIDDSSNTTPNSNWMPITLTTNATKGPLVLKIANSNKIHVWQDNAIINGSSSSLSWNLPATKSDSVSTNTIITVNADGALITTTTTSITLYIQGVATSSKLQDIALSLSVGSAQDNASLTVIDCKIELASAPGAGQQLIKHENNIAQGGFVPVNANNDNKSHFKQVTYNLPDGTQAQISTAIPIHRDFDADVTRPILDEKDLLRIHITVPVNPTVNYILSASSVTGASSQIAVWDTLQKNSQLQLPLTLAPEKFTQGTCDVWVEGLRPGKAVGETTLQIKSEKDNAIPDLAAISVTPILLNIDSITPTGNNELYTTTDEQAFLEAGLPSVPAIIITSDIIYNNVNGSPRFIQTVTNPYSIAPYSAVVNANDTRKTILGNYVFSFASTFGNSQTLIDGSAIFNPSETDIQRDTKNNTSFPLYSGGSSQEEPIKSPPAGLMEINGILGDNPRTILSPIIWPPDPTASTDIDTTEVFTDYAVWVFRDGSIYSLGTTGWKRRYVGTLTTSNPGHAGVLLWSPAKDANGNTLSKMILDSTFTRSNVDPIINAPTALDGLVKYQTDPWKRVGP